MKTFFALIILFAPLCQVSVAVEKDPANKEKLNTRRSFNFAVLPDTQFYCDTRLKLSKKWGNGDLSHYFFEQTRWVRDNQKRLNIAFLVHEGDIVQADAPEEWAIAKEAMSILVGHVPYCLCLGNHDMGFQKSNNKYGGDIAVTGPLTSTNIFRGKNLPKPRNSGELLIPSDMIIHGIISMLPE
tara:strand:- start:255 stop:806 length:552 start_codon:yes stop_codon:yes gene_type:complete